MALTLCLMAAFIMSEIFYRLRLPRFIGHILVGMILGVPFIHDMVFTDGSLEKIISTLSELGAIFLLLLVGLEINYKKLKKMERDVATISFFGSAIPLLLGFIVMKFLGCDNITAFIVGVCLSVTAEGTTAILLMELNKLNTKVGEIMTGAGAIDDVIGMVLLTVILVVVRKGGGNQLYLLPLEFMAFIILAYLVLKILPAVLRYIRREKSEVSEFSIVLIVGLLIAVISETLGLGTLVGALVAGLIIQLSIKSRREEHKMVSDLKVVSISLIVPFFFISIGMKFNVSSLSGNMDFYGLLVILTLAAVLGKFLGSLFAGPLTRLNPRQIHLLGWAMNSRGGVELVIASVAYNQLPPEIFSAIVAMSLITALFFPMVFQYEIRKNPDIMD